MSARDSWTEPGLHEVADNVFRVPLPMPNDGLRAINIYLIVEAGRVVVIDSGWALDAAVVELELRLRQLGVRGHDIERVLITHAHKDHYTLSTELRRRHGARVSLGLGEREYLAAVRNDTASDLRAARLRAHGASELAAAVRPPGASAPDPDEWADPDDWLTAPSTISFADRLLDVIATPGHTRGHVVFVDAANGLLFAGDHILPQITPSLAFEPAPGPLPLRDYLTSLRRTRELPELRLLPGHGPVTPGFHDRVGELLAHHEERLQIAWNIVAAASGPVTSYSVATQLPWTRHGRSLAALDTNNQMLAVLETAVHLDVLVDDRVLRAIDRDGVNHYEVAAQRTTDPAFERAEASR